MSLKKPHPIHHKEARFHHKFTIKKPRSTTHFFKKPLQKRENTTKEKTALLVGGLGVFDDKILGEPEVVLVAGRDEVAEDGVRL